MSQPMSSFDIETRLRQIELRLKSGEVCDWEESDLVKERGQLRQALQTANAKRKSK